MKLMMIYLMQVICLTSIVYVFGAPLLEMETDLDRDVKFLQRIDDFGADGKYEIIYTFENGESINAIGTILEINGLKFLRIEGQCGYLTEEGKPFKKVFVADEDGYFIEPFIGTRINPKAIKTIVG